LREQELLMRFKMKICVCPFLLAALTRSIEHNIRNNMTDKLITGTSSDDSANTALTHSEEQTLLKYEQIVDRGFKTCLEVSEALSAIKDQRLYRKSHKTFEAYCREKWKFTARQADRLIGAGGVVENLKQDQLVSKIPLAIPENEAQARPLTVLTPEKQIQAARAVAAKTSKPTTKDFEEVADELEEEKPRIKSYNSRNDGESCKAKEASSNAGISEDKANLEKLAELVDKSQTLVKKIRNCEALVKMLKDVANAVTQKLNGGRI
jgi:hypothetical protein